MKFLKDYLYALPCFIAASVVLSSALLSFLFLNETLARKIPGEENPKPPMSTWEVLKSPGVPAVLYILGHVSILGLMFTAIFPLFMFTSVRRGGFGFSDQRIALFLAIAGGSQALVRISVGKQGMSEVIPVWYLAWDLKSRGLHIRLHIC